MDDIQHEEVASLPGSHISLFIAGPDRHWHEEKQVPCITTVDELLNSFLRKYFEILAHGSRLGSIPLIAFDLGQSDQPDSDSNLLVFLVNADRFLHDDAEELEDTGEQAEEFEDIEESEVDLLEPKDQLISGDLSLRDAGVRDGDHLQIDMFPSMGSHPWTDLFRFLELAVASGVTGNVVYDLLKSAVTSAANRWQKLRGRKQKPFLSQDEAVSIAQACGCLVLGVNDPQRLMLSEIEHDSLEATIWKVSFRVVGDRFVDGIAIRLIMSSSTPEEIQVSVEFAYPDQWHYWYE